MTSVQELLTEAIALHRSGRRGEAEESYRRILAAVPDHADARHLLGVLASQAGRFDEAVTLICEAIAIAPSAGYFHNLAITLKNLGRIDDAIAAEEAAVASRPGEVAYLFGLATLLAASRRVDDAVARLREVVALAPSHAEAHYSLGTLLMDHGQPGDALAAFSQAIALKPDFVEAHANLGSVLKQLGRCAEAVAQFRKALEIRPGSVRVLTSLGDALAALDHLDEALDCQRQAIAADPADPVSHHNLAVALGARGDFKAALSASRLALALRPDFAEAHDALATALKGLGRLDEAASACRSALRFRPEFPSAYNNLGIVLKEQGRMDEALECFRTAIALDPAFPEAHCSLGTALADLHRFKEAMACLDKALALRPDFPIALAARAMARLTLGEFEDGWREYEIRWHPRLVGRRAMPVPQWQGEPLDGRTILLHAEQGFGDTLHFCRYATVVARAGGRVILEVQRPLTRLLARSWPDATVVGQGDPLPPFDLHCPLMSVPLAVGTRLDTIPAEVPYLAVDPGQAEAWRRRLGNGGNLKVGLAWAGAPRLDDPNSRFIDRRRSVALAALAPLTVVPGVRFVSLQKGDASAQAADAPFPLTDHTQDLTDFDDTAALIAALDLVIAVDTAVAHLAGALGKPVWILSRFDGCWRWLVDRDDSPWYPTARLFRQRQPGDWVPVVEAVVSALSAGRETHRPE